MKRHDPLHDTFMGHSLLNIYFATAAVLNLRHVVPSSTKKTIRVVNSKKNVIRRILLSPNEISAGS